MKLLRAVRTRAAALRGSAPVASEKAESGRSFPGSSPSAANEQTVTHVEADTATRSSPSPLGRGSDRLSDFPPPLSLFAPGTVLVSRFTLNRFIARGGMGEVYEAWDSELQERVAIKTIRPELATHGEILDRFRREVKQARAISHPNICRVHELFCHQQTTGNGVWFLSMEFLEGTTLSDHIRHSGPIPTGLALELAGQMVHGLSAAHSLGIVHRDFKTSNVMLVDSGPGRVRAVITDFGLALNVLRPDGALQEPGGQGTPAFMAPEQRQNGKVTFLADEYALGVVLCEMLAGMRPAQTSHPLLGPAVPPELPVRQLPAPWHRVIERCLAVRPEDRYPRLDDILVALRPRRVRWQRWAWVALPVLLAITLAIWRPFASQSQAASLAVLPFRNGTGDPQLDYLASGISEALTDDLSRMPGITVTAASVAQHYSGADDPRSVARSLQVGSVVSGRLAAQHDVLHVPIELMDVKTGRQAWGQTYEGSVSRIAELQDEISTDIAYRLKIKLDPDIKQRLKRQYSTNTLTYEAYLKGRFHLAQRTPEAIAQAIQDFQEALDHDPGYAPAFAGLADTYSISGYYGMQPPIASFTKGLAAAQHALELDSTLGEAYASRALARTLLNFEWQGAEQDYRRALELNPNYLAAHTYFAMELLVPLGRTTEAAAQMAYARAADPHSLVTTVNTMAFQYFSGDLEGALATFRPHLQEYAHLEPAVEMLAMPYLAKRANDEVIRLLASDKLSAEQQRNRAPLLGIAYAQSGRQAEALAQLKIADRSVKDGYDLAYATAALYVAVNDPQRAMDMLELAYRRREPDVIYVNVDPLLVSLRSEPRFQKLLGSMHLQ